MIIPVSAESDTNRISFVSPSDVERSTTGAARGSTSDCASTATVTNGDANYLKVLTKINKMREVKSVAPEVRSSMPRAVACC